MAFLRRKKPNIRVPTGRDAVNFRKLLFLSVKETEDLLSPSAWDRLDLRCVTLLKTKMLRAACIARGLLKKGGKRTLVQRLMASLADQRSAGTERSLKGFDSDVAFAVSRTGDVYVWGKRTGPTGLPSNASLAALTKQTYGHDSDLDSSDEEGAEAVAKTSSSPTKTETPLPHDRGDEEGDDEVANSDEEEAEGGDEDFVDPVKLASLCAEGVNSIAVGRVHCCATTKDGDVFTWGHNDHCQLGSEPVHNLTEALSKKAQVRYGVDCLQPQLWERTVAEACVITSVNVGTNHTFAITAAGEMLGFGATFNTTDHSSLARSIAKLHVSQTDIIVELACACWHSVAVVLIPPLLKGGVVYTWGSGRLGQLAQGGAQISTTPRLVTDFLTTHALIKKVCVGMYHNVALSVDDEVLNSALCPEELARRKHEQLQQVESIARQSNLVLGEKQQQLETIQQGKQSVMVAYLNAHFPKCSICTTGLICPGFQQDNDNPTLCRHCMHESRKHQDRHKERDRTVTLAYLTDVVAKLGITIDFSDVPDIELEEDLEAELDELEELEE
ncbi:hypothetical protein BBJ28_00022688 [Nothophytophthora sp. Chile5]|nr:hypothetical protein BBJ28_00022688 [Nothophytophthora sp. Chile5]